MKPNKEYPLKQASSIKTTYALVPFVYSYDSDMKIFKLSVILFFFVHAAWTRGDSKSCEIESVYSVSIVLRALSWIPMPGCIFEYYGRIPESVYAAPKKFKYPLEKCVYDNSLSRFSSLVRVSILLLLLDANDLSIL